MLIYRWTIQYAVQKNL